MVAAYILAVVSIVFLILGAWRLITHGDRYRTQGRIWLAIGLVFAAVSTLLFYQG